MNLEPSCTQLDGLPDEIILLVLKNLFNVEVLCYLTDVNHRLKRIAHDPILTRYLSLMKYSSNVVIHSLSESMLDRLCLKILPEIHEKIQWLNLESSSMERILLTRNYPNLTGLGLYNISMEKARSVFLGRIYFLHGQLSSFDRDNRLAKISAEETCCVRDPSNKRNKQNRYVLINFWT